MKLDIVELMQTIFPKPKIANYLHKPIVNNQVRFIYSNEDNVLCTAINCRKQCVNEWKCNIFMESAISSETETKHLTNVNVVGKTLAANYCADECCKCSMWPSNDNYSSDWRFISISWRLSSIRWQWAGLHALTIKM